MNQGLGGLVLFHGSLVQLAGLRIQFLGHVGKPGGR